jgi:hypothetical protein
MAIVKFSGTTNLTFLGTATLKFSDPVNTWVFLQTSSNDNLYINPRTTVAAGSSGCASVSDGENALNFAFPPEDEAIGKYGRVTVFDNLFVACGEFHWFVVQAI